MLVVRCSLSVTGAADEVEAIGTTVAVTVSSSPVGLTETTVDVIGTMDVVTWGVPGQSVTVGAQEVTVKTVVE